MAEQGNVEAQHNLGVMYDEGKGIITDYYEAYIWFSIAKASGNKRATKVLDKSWENILIRYGLNAACE